MRQAFSKREGKIFKALSDPYRRHILIVLGIMERVGEKLGLQKAQSSISFSGLQTVTELIDDRGKSKLQYNLKILKSADLIINEIRQGERERTYSVYYLSELGRWVVFDLLKYDESVFNKYVDEVLDRLRKRGIDITR